MARLAADWRKGKHILTLNPLGLFLAFWTAFALAFGVHHKTALSDWERMAAPFLLRSWSTSSEWRVDYTRGGRAVKAKLRKICKICRPKVSSIKGRPRKWERVLRKKEIGSWATHFFSLSFLKASKGFKVVQAASLCAFQRPFLSRF